MPGVNAYKDGVVSRLYKGLQGLVKSRKITYVEGEGRLVVADDGRGSTAPYDRARHVVLATGSYARTPARPGDRRRAGHHQRPGPEPRLRPRARRSCSAAASSASSSPASGSPSAPTSPSSRRSPTSCRSRTRRLQAARARVPQARHRASSSARGSPASSTPRRASRVSLENGKQIEAELLLVAVGRGPSSAGLGYEEAGVAMERGFVLVDELCRTNVPSVYAVGDLIPDPAAGPRRLRRGHPRRRARRRAQPARRSTTTASRASPTASPRSPPSASPRRRPRSGTAPTRSAR